MNGAATVLLLGAVALGKPLSVEPRGFAEGVTGGNQYCDTPTLITTTEYDVAGSFSQAIDGEAGDRCIKFAVSGYIDIPLGQTIRPLGDNVTVDCRDAPKPGVVLRGLIYMGEGHDGMDIPADNWIWRHCRHARGGGAPGSPFVANNVDGMLLDHPTFVYGADEGGSLFAIYTGNRVRNIHFEAPMFTHQLGCTDPALGCFQVGHAVPHNYSSLIGGTIENISIWRGFWGYAEWRNPSIIIGQNPVGQGPTPSSTYAEKVQNWFHMTGKSSNLAENDWNLYLDQIDNVYTAAKLDMPEDIGTLNCTPAVCEQKVYTLRNREGATIATLSDPSGSQELIQAALGVSIDQNPEYWASERQVTHHHLPSGDSTQTVAIVASEAGAMLPCRSPFEERAIRDALAGEGRDIIDDETDLGGWPDLTASESCSGFKNKPIDAGANTTASGATNTSIAFNVDCTDPDTKPFGDYYWVTEEPTDGVVEIDHDDGTGTFDATGVVPAAYPFTVECCDGYSCDMDTVTITVTS